MNKMGDFSKIISVIKDQLSTLLSEDTKTFSSNEHLDKKPNTEL